LNKEVKEAIKHFKQIREVGDREPWRCERHLFDASQPPDCSASSR
jgi:hypothetical protein